MSELMVKIYVTTCNKNRHLVYNFAKLFNKFWSPNQPVTIVCYQPPDEQLPDNFSIMSFGNEDDKKVAQLDRLVRTIDDEYFILMAEDFYLTQPVELAMLNTILNLYAMNYDRLSLQSIADGYQDTSKFTGQYLGTKLYYLENREQYLCSLEASVWRREFMKKYIGQHKIQDSSDRDVEIHMSNFARKDQPIVIVPEQRIVHYTDALRGGQPRIKFEDNKMIVLRQEGWVNNGVTI